MNEISVSELDPDLRRLAVMARAAAAKDQGSVARDLCLQILRRHPGCVGVRELWFEVELKKGSQTLSFLSRTRGLLALAKTRKSTGSKSNQSVSAADAVLAEDFTSRAGWVQLIDSAQGEGWSQTEALASETYTKAHPDDIEAGLKWASSLQRQQRFNDALQLAQRLLAKHPNNAEVLALVRKVSVDVTMSSGRLGKRKSE